MVLWGGGVSFGRRFFFRSVVEEGGGGGGWMGGASGRGIGLGCCEWGVGCCGRRGGFWMMKMELLDSMVVVLLFFLSSLWNRLRFPPRRFGGCAGSEFRHGRRKQQKVSQNHVHIMQVLGKTRCGLGGV